MEKTTVKVTKEQVILFQTNAEKYLDRHSSDRNLFTHALNRVTRKTKNIIDDYNDDAQAIRLSYTTIDKETGRNVIQPDKQKLVAKETRNLLREEVEAPQFLSDFIPADIGHLEWQVFYPFVLKDEFPPESKPAESKTP